MIKLSIFAHFKARWWGGGFFYNLLEIQIRSYNTIEIFKTHIDIYFQKGGENMEWKECIKNWPVTIKPHNSTLVSLFSNNLMKHLAYNFYAVNMIKFASKVQYLA